MSRRVERSADLTARARFIEVRARAIQREVNQLHLLARKNSAGPRIRSNPQQQFRPFGVPFPEFVQRRTPGPVYCPCSMGFSIKLLFLLPIVPPFSRSITALAPHDATSGRPPPSESIASIEYFPEHVDHWRGRPLSEKANVTDARTPFVKPGRHRIPACSGLLGRLDLLRISTTMIFPSTTFAGKEPPQSPRSPQSTRW